MTAIRQKQLEFVDFQPSFDWKEESDEHLLIIPLPGFVKEQLRVTLNRNLGIITVQGRRQIEGNKFIRFIKGFPLPSNCKTEGIRAVCAAGNLTVSILKETPTASKNNNCVKQHSETLESKNDAPSANEASREDKLHESPQEQRTPSAPPESKISELKNKKSSESNEAEGEIDKSNNSDIAEHDSDKKNMIGCEKNGWQSKGVEKFRAVKDVIACRERDRRLLGNVGAAVLVLAAMAAFTAYLLKSWSWKKQED